MKKDCPHWAVSHPTCVVSVSMRAWGQRVVVLGRRRSAGIEELRTWKVFPPPSVMYPAFLKWPGIVFHAEQFSLWPRQELRNEGFPSAFGTPLPLVHTPVRS
eukprot:SAG11_NODE_13279_length_662_cov_0.642984_1_plen_101_part_10